MRGVSQKISSCIRGCSRTVCTLSRYNINTVPVDVASSLEVNHIKSMCCATVSCDCALTYLLSVIRYMNVAYQLMNVCMLSFSCSNIEG